jgi:hypothetical protein
MKKLPHLAGLQSVQNTIHNSFANHTRLQIKGSWSITQTSRTPTKSENKKNHIIKGA